MRFSTEALVVAGYVAKRGMMDKLKLQLDKTGEALGFSQIEVLVGAINELSSADLLNATFSLEAVELRPGKKIEELETMTSKVFIVHGHDGEMRSSLEAFVRRLGLEPVIIADRPSGGRTIIEMIEHHGDVQYAVVLLTPDDRGGLNSEDAALSARARQNVILELGYFCGRLGRNRVMAVHKGDIEVPSDYHGVIYVRADSPGTDWRIEIARNLKSAGLNIDVDSLF